MYEAGPILHFLVIAAASRGARFFIKKALLQGHSVTALCRAADDRAALKRIEACLVDTVLVDGRTSSVDARGVLDASSQDILDPETYRSLLDEHSSINRVCCFVGGTSVRQMIVVTKNCIPGLFKRSFTACVKAVGLSFFITVRRAAKAFQDKIYPNYQPTLGPNGS